MVTEVGARTASLQCPAAHTATHSRRREEPFPGGVGRVPEKSPADSAGQQPPGDGGARGGGR